MHRLVTTARPAPARHRLQYREANRSAGDAIATIARRATWTLAAVIVALATGEALAESLLPILVYHQIRTGADGPADGATAISLARFESQMRYLHGRGYVTLTTDQVVDFMRHGTAPSGKIVAIHFDDGWKSALAALPVLDRFGFGAAFWIIPGTGIGWPHMDWEEVRMLAKHPRIEIHSHTMTHPFKAGETLVDWIAGRTPDKGIDQVRWELVESRRLLEDKLGRPVPYLAWPGGHHDEALIRLAQEAGYRALFTMNEGVNRPGQHLLRIRRTIVDGSCDEEAFAQTLADGRHQTCDSGTRSARD